MYLSLKWMKLKCVMIKNKNDFSRQIHDNED